MGINAPAQLTLSNLYKEFKRAMKLSAYESHNSPPPLIHLLNDMEYLQHSQILGILVNHRMVNYPDTTSDDLHNIFTSHLVNGHCDGHNSEGTIGCTSVKHQLPALYLGQTTLALSILTLVKQYCNFHMLK